MKACFFSTASLEQINREQYSLIDIKILKDLGFEVEIANCFRRIPLDCDLYYSWWASGSVMPLIVAKLVGKPNIIVAGGNEAMLYRDSSSGLALGYLGMPFYKKIATRVTLRLSTVVTCVSQFMVNDVTRLAGRSVLVVPNVVDTDRFFPDVGQPKKYVTTCFRLDHGPTNLKRGENFLRAAYLVLKQKPNEVFVIIGFKGNAYDKLQALVEFLGIKDSVIFTGAIHNNEVRDWLVQSKCYVQISDTETFGVAVAEAMSTGTPVIVSRKGALPELVGKLGTYVDHNSVESIAFEMLGVLDMTLDRREQLGEELRNSVNMKYSYKTRHDAIKLVVQNLINGIE
ncbi:glycosyltransferase family 4 protein [Limnohabitans sp.]|uniref:glycosyltransferase family 4 protein n=1 Tax=Limnohabitans sp. TaxID=1907725 RepID=UPI002FDD8FE4